MLVAFPLGVDAPVVLGDGVRLRFRPADRPLRADAARNRTAIVAAAQRAFAESGLQVPFDEIARQAGVGEATCVLLIANAGVVAATADTAPDAWQRHIEYMLQAFAADHTQPLPPPAATVLSGGLCNAHRAAFFRSPLWWRDR